MDIERRGLIAGGGAAALLGTAPLGAAIRGDAALDALVRTFLQEFDIPGAAVAIVRPGQPDVTRGYGIRRLGEPAPVDARTLFAIASNSKAFTAAALAILVDEGKVEWDAPVTRYLPDFRMADPRTTELMTVRDLLVHRSGLPLGAGDLMIWPKSSHTLDDILHGLRYLKPERGFRTGYAYDNILYLVAGMIVARVSGQSWADFVSARLLGPLGMANTAPMLSRITITNVAGRHARLGPPVHGLGPMRAVAPDEQDKLAAAGGINTCAADVVHWLRAQLALGRLPDGRRLWSEAQSKAMWSPQTLISSGPGPTPKTPDASVVTSYALGWRVETYRGQRLLSHGGTVAGQESQHALLPELGIGLAVYCGTEERLPCQGLRNALLDRLMGAPPFDWLAETRARVAKENAAALAQSGGGAPQRPSGQPSLPLQAYVGRYRDPWYGDIVVLAPHEGLFITFVPTPAFQGALEPWGNDSFRTSFIGKGVEDAVVTFAVEGGRVTGVTMKPLSPLADFSYDFQHLAFVPVR